MAENLDRATLRFAQDTITELKKQLSKPRTRFGRSATWKDGRPTSVRRTPYRGKIDASGSLSRSMKAKLINNGAEITMLAYGQAVDEGRRPRSRGIPPNVLESWVRRKITSELDIKSLTYLINRKIKWFGIDPTNFIDDALQIVDRNDADYIYDAVFADIIFELDKTMESPIIKES